MSITMSRYGQGKKDKPSKPRSEDIERPVLDENSPYNELCHFADQYKLWIEIDKPFNEFDEMYLKVVDKENNVIKKILLDSIETLDLESSKMLNELGKEFK